MLRGGKMSDDGSSRSGGSAETDLRKSGFDRAAPIAETKPTTSDNSQPNAPVKTEAASNINPLTPPSPLNLTGFNVPGGMVYLEAPERDVTTLVKLAKAARNETPEQRAARIALQGELLSNLKMWRWLAVCAVAALAVGLITCLIAIMVLAVTKIKDDELDGPSFALIIFTFAVFVASPAVLLLLGRPLVGVDNYAPGITSSKDEDKDEAKQKDSTKPA